MNIGFEGAKSIYILPHAFRIGVKNMRAILVHQDAAFIVSLGVAIACDVVTAFEYINRMASLCQLARNNRATEAGAGNGNWLGPASYCQFNLPVASSSKR